MVTVQADYARGQIDSKREKLLEADNTCPFFSYQIVAWLAGRLLVKLMDDYLVQWMALLFCGNQQIIETSPRRSPSFGSNSPCIAIPLGRFGLAAIGNCDENGAVGKWVKQYLSLPVVWSTGAGKDVRIRIGWQLHNT